MRAGSLRYGLAKRRGIDQRLGDGAPIPLGKAREAGKNRR